MSEKTDWETQAANFLKAELTRRGINYDELRQALEKLGIQKTTNNITVTINRGKFSFAFLLQCAKAIGINKLQLD
ncbi:MAG: hypothetical protein COV52_09640 [Gammaproteobacteria bacterium CG11_big_fil_rev_8_21_14_0_20_46_22]|nr:MAG: hypothetical protein COV52_09640 [Gammaproteobacteria bacterium CG11_big_fil_rev_8_21_14_0_20_46_22]